VNEWIQKWETLYGKCIKARIPDVEGNRATLDFINALHAISPEFAQIWDVKLLDESIDFRVLVQKYRDYRRNTQNRSKARGQHGVFQTTTPTLQGMDSEGSTVHSKTEDKKKTYICGGKHTWSRC
jgi:hypothetical protein